MKSFEMNELSRQTALLARLAERKAHGAHDGKPYQGLLYALDECMELEAEAMATRAENDVLRGLLAKGDKDCVYCGLPAAEISKCLSGFPGCSRMDDMMAAPITKAESENDGLRMRVSDLEKQLAGEPIFTSDTTLEDGQ